MAINKYPQQIYQKEEGETYYRWCWYFFHTPFFVLLALSILWPFMPDAWLTSDVIHAIDTWFRGHFTKLAHEGAAYDGMEPLWGTSYVSFVGMCWTFVVIANTILVIPLIIMTLKFGHPLSHEQRHGIWKSSLSILIFGYLTFGQWMDLANLTPGHFATLLTRSWLIYPFAAALAAVIHMSFAILIISMIKTLKFRNSER